MLISMENWNWIYFICLLHAVYLFVAHIFSKCAWYKQETYFITYSESVLALLLLDYNMCWTLKRVFKKSKISEKGFLQNLLRFWLFSHTDFKPCLLSSVKKYLPTEINQNFSTNFSEAAITLLTSITESGLVMLEIARLSSEVSYVHYLILAQCCT